MTGRRLIGYVRVSTGEQAASGLGLDAQRAAITRHVALTGDTLIDVVADEGASGKNLDRPGFATMLDRLVAGEADGLVAAKLDRVSRSIIDLAHLMEWCDEGRLDLVILDQQLDTAGPMGKFVAHVMAAAAQLEREQGVARTTAALAALREQGKPISRPAVLDEYPDVVLFMRQWHVQGWTLQQIADALNDQGIPTVRGGAEWRPSSVQTALGYKRPPARRVRTELPAHRNRRGKARA